MTAQPVLPPMAPTRPVSRAPRPRARDHVSSYAALLAQVRAAGLLERRLGWYLRHVVVLTLVLAGLVTAFVGLGDSWWQLAVAAGVGLLVAQLGFLGHDAAHRQVFASSRANLRASLLISTLGIGLSHGWWIHKHNKHHASPNEEGRDPDIAPGAIAFTPAVAATRRTGVVGWFTRHQGSFFFPLLLLEGVNLHVAGIQTLVQRPDLPHRRLEATLIALRLGGYLAVVFVFLPPGKAVAFLAVQLGVFGFLLGAAFAPNHKGMPIVPRGARLDFLTRQVVMSRNVRGGPGVDTMMGGLNYQIEHHLFPSMPRPNLRRAQPLVRAFCEEHRVTYTETTLVASYGIVVRYLDAVGLGERDPFACPLAGDLGRS